MRKLHTLVVLAVVIVTGIRENAADSAVPKEVSEIVTKTPASIDARKVSAEIEAHYAKAPPEIQEYVRCTAQTFGKSGLLLAEDVFSDLSAEVREKRIQHLATLLSEAEYGRHLCAGLAEARAPGTSDLFPV